MIVLDSAGATPLDCDGFNAGTSKFRTRSGVKCRPASPAYQFVGRKMGAALLADPETPNMEIELPLKALATTQDQLLEAHGQLRDKADKAASLASQGGMETSVKIPGTTYTSSVRVVAMILDEDQDVTIDQVRRKRKELTVKLICLPFYLGPEKLAASGRKPQGLPLADVLIPSVGGDTAGIARVDVTNRGTAAQQFAMMGMQWRNYAAGPALQSATTLDVASAPLNGTLTGATNQIQTLTKAGTISGGAWSLGWEGYVFNAAFAFNASPATVQAAIDAQIGAGMITVGGSALSAGSMTFTFVGTMSGRNASALTFAHTLTGGGTVTRSTTTAAASAYVATSLYSEWSSFARSANQADTGTYQLWALVMDTGSSAGMARIRAAWSVGDTASVRENRSASVDATGGPVWVYLGDAHITPRSAGTHRWNVRFDAMTVGTAGTQLRLLDWAKVPTELGRATVKSKDGTTESVIGIDDFGATVGVITGDAATLGGNWVSMGGLTDADDITQTGAPANTVIRTAVSDAATGYRYGRGVVLGAATATDQSVSATISQSVSSGSIVTGVIARFVDNDNFVAAGIYASGFFIARTVAGGTTVNSKAEPGFNPAIAKNIELVVRSDGRIQLYCDGVVKMNLFHSSYATGGALASGKVGLYDWNSSATASTRSWSNFKHKALAPSEVAIFPNRSMRWQYDGSLEREATGGTYFGVVTGAMRSGAPMLGAAGADALTNRLVLATTDFSPDEAPSTNPSPSLDYAVYVREAFQLGRWSL